MIDLPPDPYQALGVPKDATIPEIRSAHRKLVLRCHPDKVQDPQLKAQKQVEFEMVQRAYELLSDDRERQKYDDRALLANLRAQFTKRAEAPAPGLGSQRAPTRPRGYDHSRSRDDIDGSRHGPTRSDVESFAEQYVSRSRPKAAKGPPTLKRSAAYTAYRSSTPPTTGSVSEGQPGARSHARAHSADESSGGQSSSGFDRFFKRGSSGRQSPGIPSPASPSFHQPQVSSSPAPGEATGSRWNRFRRSSAPSRPRRTASRAGSQGSRASGRSVGSQVSQEDMDKFDYVLQAMEDLLDKHIKKLRGRFLRDLGRSARSHKDQCREALVTLQTKVLEQYEHNGARRGDVAESVDDHARYRLLVDLFDDLRLELADFGLHDLSRQGAGSYCTGFCSRIDSFAARLTLYGVKATETK